MSGVSGATAGNEQVVLIAGLAGMLASSISMGTGAYLAAKSEREVYEAELKRERLEIQTDPESSELRRLSISSRFDLQSRKSLLIA